MFNPKAASQLRWVGGWGGGSGGLKEHNGQQRTVAEKGTRVEESRNVRGVLRNQVVRAAPEEYLQREWVSQRVKTRGTHTGTLTDIVGKEARVSLAEAQQGPSNCHCSLCKRIPRVVKMTTCQLCVTPSLFREEREPDKIKAPTQGSGNMTEWAKGLPRKPSSRNSVKSTPTVR